MYVCMYVYVYICGGGGRRETALSWRETRRRPDTGCTSLSRLTDAYATRAIYRAYAAILRGEKETPVYWLRGDKETPVYWLHYLDSTNLLTNLSELL